MLRCGYTTGTCAALAAGAAAALLLTGQDSDTGSLATPKGLGVSTGLAGAGRGGGTRWGAGPMRSV